MLPLSNSGVARFSLLARQCTVSVRNTPKLFGAERAILFSGLTALVIRTHAELAALVIVAVFPASLSVTAAGTGPQFYTLSDFERALPGHPLSSHGSVHLYAGGGEYQAFQIAVPAPPSGLTLTGVMSSDLAGASGHKIPASNVTIYREHYVHVDSPSPDRHGANRPMGAGWYPDALIPLRDPDSGKPLTGKYRAVPFHLDRSSGEPPGTFTIWIDVFVPRGTAPGDYHATITLSSDRGKIEVPWSLTVWRFQVPLKPSLRSSLLFWNPVGKEAVEELLRNRLMPQHVPSATPSIERRLETSLGLSMSGTDFWSGADNSHCSMKPAPAPDDLKRAVRSHDPKLWLYNYTADEIGNCKGLYPALKEWGRALHQANIKNLVVMAPVPELFDDGSGHPAVDVWVLLPMQFENDSALIAAARAHGSEIWSYNAAVQDAYSPKWLIDYDTIGYRLQAGFLNQTYGLTGVLYWRIDRWDGDPWTHVNNTGVFSAGNYPGEGMLLYPGDPVGLHGGAVPSIRLKELRAGVQDYEYVEMLKHLGRGDWALGRIHTVAPDWKNWSRSGEAVEAVRRELGAEINKLSP